MSTTTDQFDRITTRSCSRRRRWRAGLSASVLALVPLTLSACGGGQETASDASGAEVPAAAGGDIDAFQECMAENGIETVGPPAQDGSSDGSQPARPDPDAMAQAEEACGDLAPEGMGQGGPGPGAGPGGGGGGGGGGGEEMQAYADCLAENGVEPQTPGAGGGQPPTGEPPAAGEESAGPPSGSPFGLDTSDPEVAAAVDACADLEPTMPSKR